MNFYFPVIVFSTSLYGQSAEMNHKEPRIIMLYKVRSFDSYMKMLCDAEDLVKLFSRNALQVAIQRFSFIYLETAPPVPLPVTINKSPFRMRYANDTLPKKVILMTHETDLESGDRFSLLGGNYFLEKLRPSLQTTEYVYGFYLN